MDSTKLAVEDEKYIVFKRQEFEEWIKTRGGIGITLPSFLEDATVIRGQDLFAAPALDVYAASIAIVLKFGGMTDTTRIELQAAADYFHNRANESREIAFKTPDKKV